MSPETAAASALTGVITDPRTLGIPYPYVREPARPVLNADMLVPPLSAARAAMVTLEKGPNIASLPELDAVPEFLELPVLLMLGDDISTDEILPAGVRVLPFRSNIPKISGFTFDMVDPTYPDRALEIRESSGHAIVAGRNYGQGSSREHAALAPRYLGLRLVIAAGFARIHRQNLVNCGVLPLRFLDPGDRLTIEAGDRLHIEHVHDQLRAGHEVEVVNETRDYAFQTAHDLSERQVEVLLAGGLINRARQGTERPVAAGARP